jgi:hypothetical protein
LNNITLEFFLSTKTTPVTPGDAIWDSPLPLSRRPQATGDKTSNFKTVTYGEYFEAVGDFLKKDHYRAVQKALAGSIEAETDPPRVDGLAVFLVKHGEFYHPARVVVKFGENEVPFVVNVAISKAGRDHIRGEFNLLERLYLEFRPECGRLAIPKAYHLDEIPSGANRVIPMFIGQWFDGFCEFHITADHQANRSNLIVWGQDETSFFLTLKQAEDVYRKAAFILTTRYNFFTFEQISAWHHAAGDFILKPVDSDRVDLRLITVRKYIPLIKNKQPDPETLVESLLLFLINLTLRNRVDRLDGTGSLAWAHDFALRGTIAGFFNGLRLVVSKEDLPETFPAEFKNYIQAHSKEALVDLFTAVANRTPGTSPENAFIKKRLRKHADLFCSLLSAGSGADQGDTDTT